MNRRAGTGSFKEFSGQYYQEVKYSDRDYDLIAIEEAWEKYQTNVDSLSPRSNSSVAYSLSLMLTTTTSRIPSLNLLEMKPLHLPMSSRNFSR